MILGNPKFGLVFNAMLAASLLMPQTAIPCCTGDEDPCCESCTPHSDSGAVDPAREDNDHEAAPHCILGCVAMCCVKVMLPSYGSFSLVPTSDLHQFTTGIDTVAGSDHCQRIFHPPKL